ncbi:bacterial proteasome activator family protein [Stackebrandtia soli]|uniref:bacterial proteasome activator family protein n=1 Tax=Stackebrandtia soli TaxID=1892856 RepID=UPI0039E7E6F8
MTDDQTKPDRDDDADDAQPVDDETEREGETQATVLVMGPDGKPVGTMEVDPETGESGDPAKLVEQPAKVMRVGSMIKQLLEEVRAAPLDKAGRSRLKEIHARSIAELEDGLAPELRDELERLSLPFNGEDPPSESELRIAQAQLVGWLEGLFHGIQAALMAQQMAARMQLEQMRRGGVPALPSGGQVPPGVAQLLAASGDDDEHGPGQYL